jgi:hypothetical protein
VSYLRHKHRVERSINVPKWLSKQLMQAFRQKDRTQIRFLNRCWFSFIKKEYEFEKPN